MKLVDAVPLPKRSTQAETTVRPRSIDLGQLGLNVMLYTTLVFLLVPLAVVTIASFTGGGYVSFPPKAPLGFEWYIEFFTSDRFLPAMINSLIIGALVVLVSGSVGILAAVGWTMRDFQGKELVYYLLFLPFLVPGLVLAIGLVTSFQPLGIGFLYGSRWTVIIGHSLWATPLVFVIMVAVLQGIDPNITASAKDLGARPFRAFWEISLPLVRAGIMAAIILAFVISFHEFIISLFLLASAQVRTLPVEVWNSLRFELSPVIAAIDAFLIVTVVVALAVLSKLVGIERVALR